MSEVTAVLTGHENYGLNHPVIGFAECSSTLDPAKKMLTFGDGSWIDVKLDDLVFVELTEVQIAKIFPLSR